MRLLGTSLFLSAVAFAAACSNPDVKLGNGDQQSTTGGSGGTSGSGGNGGSGASTSVCTGTVVGSGNCASLEDLKLQANDLCATFNQTLSDIAYDDACEPGHAAFAKVTCCGDIPEPPPPPPSCVYEVAGDPAACTDDATLKEQANEACLAANLELVDVVYDDACGPGSSTYAKYVCCAGGEPPPPPEVCFADLLGDPVICSDNKELWTQGFYLCANKNAQLTNLTLSDECGPDSSHYAKVECCSAAPPPPNQCFDDFVGDPAVCMDNDALESQASSLCASKGGKLQSFAPDETCGPSSSHFAKFSCCAADEPPPPPTDVCSAQAIDGSCTANDDLATMAEGLCAAENAIVEGLAFDEVCGPGTSQSAKFVCCSENPPPPPATCFGTSIDGTGCTGNEELKLLANQECSSVGGELASLTFDDACGPGSSKSAQYACCTPDPGK
jgi:hypothetical protein